MKAIRHTFSLCAVAALLAACGGSATNEASAPDALLSKSGGRPTGAATLHAPEEYGDLIQRIYISYFGRPADYLGLQYWEKIFSDKGMPLSMDEASLSYPNGGNVRALIDTFVLSEESRGLYTGSDAAYVNAVYLNIFNRNSEDAGRKFWAGFVARNELSRAQVVMRILSGAQNDDAVIVRKKVQAATYFTNALAKGSVYILNYTGDNINEAARQLLAEIAATTDMTAFQARIDAFLEAMISTGPGPAIPTVRYSGFSYLQDMDSSPSYPSKYTMPQGLASNAGLLAYGEAPVALDWARDPAGGAISYAAPITSSMSVSFSGVSIGRATLPELTMLCRTPAGVPAGSVKSTDVVVTNSAKVVMTAQELANLTLSFYREDCVLSSGANNAVSFVFDASGNAVIKSKNGESTYSSDLVNKVLNGQLLIDLTTGQYWTFKAYKFLKSDGSYGFAIVQHQGDKITALTDGTLGIWAQQ